jgi:hypothetical protein
MNQPIFHHSNELIAPHTMVSDMTSHKAIDEEAFEQALDRAKILYCKSDQMIGNFQSLPHYVVPKHKIVVFLGENSSQQNTNVYEGWKVFRFQTNDIDSHVQSCID